MRVGLASTHMWSESAFRNAGISKSSYRLIDSLSANFPTDSFTLFANTAFQPGQDWLDRANLKVSSTVPIGRGKRALWEFFGSAREVSRGDFDVWLSTSHAVPARSKTPTAAIIHDMIPLIYPEFQDWAQSAYLKLALVQVAKRVNLILTNSQQTKQDIVRFSRVKPEKIVVIPFGPGAKLKPRALDSVTQEELGDVPYRRFFFSLGTLEPRKNLARLFEAMALLTGPEFADVGLVVGGGVGWREHGIFETLENLKIGNRVTFFGYVPDERLPSLFAACSGFVFPSVYEGFGMPLVEAMQLGAIVLCGGSGAMNEVAGDASLSFDPADAAQIAGAMKRCLQLSSEERCDLVTRARKQAAEVNWDLGARATRQALEELVSRP